MSTFKKLAGDTALYGVSTILGRLLNWALMPLHTRVFANPEELASNVKIYTYIGVLQIVLLMGLDTAFFRYAARNKDAIQPYFNRTQSLILAVNLLVGAALILGGPWLARAIGYPEEVLSLRWAAALLAIDAITAIPFARLRVQNQARRFVVAKLTNIGLNVALNVFFLVVCRDIYNGAYLPALQPAVDLLYFPAIGAGYIILANLIANAVNLLQLADQWRGFRFGLHRQEARQLLVYAFPMMLMSLTGVVNQLSDRLLLDYLLPDDFYLNVGKREALGIYGQCYKMSVFMAMAIQSFKFAADPFFFARAEDKNAPGLLADVTKWFVVVCVVIWVGISLNMDVLGLLIGESYRSGLGVVPLLTGVLRFCPAYPLLGMNTCPAKQN